MRTQSKKQKKQILNWHFKQNIRKGTFITLLVIIVVAY